jgi:Flp pilus assembly protein TadG
MIRARLWRSRRAVAALEFALTAPFLLLIRLK